MLVFLMLDSFDIAVHGVARFLACRLLGGGRSDDESPEIRVRRKWFRPGSVKWQGARLGADTT